MNSSVSPSAGGERAVRWARRAPAAVWALIPLAGDLNLTAESGAFPSKLGPAPMGIGTV